MTRSARQYLVLDDPAFSKRYADAWRDAQLLLETVAAALPHTAPALFDQWRQAGDQAWDILQGPARPRTAAPAGARKALAPLPGLASAWPTKCARKSNAATAPCWPNSISAAPCSRRR
jgi:two-component system sensor histidine kinase GlrK